MIDLSTALESITAAIVTTGEMQKQHLGRKNLVTTSKSTGIDLVTEVDKMSEKMLVDAINLLYPEHDILAEESGLATKESEYLWIIDPLDGTTNYAQGLPVFTISVALQHNGETVLGVVYAPVFGDLFTAVRGQGAYHNNKEIHVSAKTELIECVLATGFPYDIASQQANNISYFSHIAPQARGIRRLGSAALDAAYTAAGIFDGYWELKLAPWDVAAGLLLVEEAGGEVVHFRDDRGISIICGNKVICQKIFQEIKKIDSTYS